MRVRRPLPLTDHCWPHEEIIAGHDSMVPIPIDRISRVVLLVELLARVGQAERPVDQADGIFTCNGNFTGEIPAAAAAISI